MYEDETDQVRRNLLRRARNGLTLAAAGAAGISLNRTGEAGQLNEIADNLSQNNPTMLNAYKNDLQNQSAAIQDSVGKPTFSAAIAGTAAAITAGKIDKGGRLSLNSGERISRRGALGKAGALALAAGTGGIVYNVGRGQGIHDAGDQLPTSLTAQEDRAIVPVFQEAGISDVKKLTASGTLAAAGAVVMGNHLANEHNRARDKNKSGNER